MDGHTPPRRPGLPWGLVGLIGLVALIELFVARNGDTFLSMQQLDWNLTGRAAYSKSAKASVLCFGDSMVKLGVVAPIVEEHLGKPVFNFAVTDGKAPSTYFLFRRTIESGARPGAVLVDFSPEGLFQSPDTMLENPGWTSLLNPREIVDLSLNFKSRGFFGVALVAKMLRSHRCRHEIRADILAALAGKSTPNEEVNALLRRNRRLNRGGMLLVKNTNYDGAVPPPIGQVLYPSHWLVRPENRRYMRLFFGLAARHKIPVFWLLPANAPNVQEGRDRTGLTARYDHFARRLIDMFPNVRMIDARHSGFGHTVFIDWVHLNRSGAAVQSLEVAEILRRDLAGQASRTRWYEVPRYRDRPITIALEDTEESRSAVRRRIQERHR